jgi:hypothetical protein
MGNRRGPVSDARGSVQNPVETIQGLIEQMRATVGELGVELFDSK